MVRYVVAAVVVLFLIAAVSVSVAADDKAATVWSFDKDEVGKPPTGFEFAVTAKKVPGK